MSASTCIIISFYDRRPIAPLWQLVSALDSHEPGREYCVGLVINRTGDHPLALPASDRLIEVHERPNLGMNIGAWDAGWRHFRGFETYVFLQDECYPVRSGWLDALARTAERPEVGLVGESINTAWDKPWDVLRNKQASVAMPEHFVNGAPANRVDAYLDFMRRHAIPPGPTGRHVRSLIWAARREALERFGGFPIGANYGECIAAEIGTTKRVEAAGLHAVQVSEQPFTFVRHREWNQDEPGGPFMHAVPRPEVFQLPSAHVLSLGQLTWRTTLRLLGRRLRRPLVRGVQ
jgi:hypothetical protein